MAIDVPVPAAARGDGAHHHVARALARAAVQGPAGAAHRLRARLHEHQPRGLHRLRQVTTCLSDTRRSNRELAW